MDSPLRSTALFAFAYLGALPGFLFAQVTIGSVTPTQATIGTSVKITGTGFAAAKPKVTLTQAGSPKKYTLKVTSFKDTEIQAAILTAVAGSFDVNVTVKTVTATSVNSLTIVGPGILSLSATSGFPKDAITIHGDQFGTAKGKVTLGGKAAPITLWSNTAVTFEIPKLSAGVYDLALTNKIGVDTLPASVTVNTPQPPIPGQEEVQCKIDGKLYKVNGNTFAATYAVPLTLVTVQGSTATTSPRILQIAFPFDFFTGAVPATLTSPNGMVVSLTETTTGVPPSATNWTNLLPGSSFTVTVTERHIEDKILVGSFSGTLILAQGAGAASVTITDGQFKATLLGA